MSKIWLIATTEFISIARTKTFLFGIVILPIMMAIMVLLPGRAAQQVTIPEPLIEEITKTFRLTVLDPTGAFRDGLISAATRYNQRTILSGRPKVELFVVTPPENKSEETLLQEMRGLLLEKKVDAFVLLPKNIIKEPTQELLFYAEDNRGFIGWFHEVLNEQLTLTRLRGAGLTEAQIETSTPQSQ